MEVSILHFISIFLQYLYVSIIGDFFQMSMKITDNLYISHLNFTYKILNLLLNPIYLLNSN